MEAEPSLSLAALLAASVAAALACAAPSALASGESGTGEARGRIDFAVVIPVVLRVAPVDEPGPLSVRAEDIARGYVDAQAALRVTSNNAGGLMAALSCDPALVTRVRARIGGQVVEADSPGTAARIDLGKMSDTMLRVDYRIFLAPGAVPGTYRWPVGLRLAPGA